MAYWSLAYCLQTPNMEHLQGIPVIENVQMGVGKVAMSPKYVFISHKPYKIETKLVYGVRTFASFFNFLFFYCFYVPCVSVSYTHLTLPTIYSV